jgi:hypothetical protein
MGELDTSWASIRKVFASPRIKDDIVKFDAHNANPKEINAVQKAISEKHDSFVFESVERSSKAAAENQYRYKVGYLLE